MLVLNLTKYCEMGPNNFSAGPSGETQIFASHGAKTRQWSCNRSVEHTIYFTAVQFQSTFHAAVILSKLLLISGCEFQLQSSSLASFFLFFPRHQHHGHPRFE